MKRRDHWQHWLGQVFPDCEDVEQPYKFPNPAGEKSPFHQLLLTDCPFQAVGEIACSTVDPKLETETFRLRVRVDALNPHPLFSLCPLMPCWRRWRSYRR
jgi:hypothetical protein